MRERTVKEGDVWQVEDRLITVVRVEGNEVRLKVEPISYGEMLDKCEPVAVDWPAVSPSGATESL